MSDVDRVEVAVNQIRQVPEGLSLEQECRMVDLPRSDGLRIFRLLR